MRYQELIDTNDTDTLESLSALSMSNLKTRLYKEGDRVKVAPNLDWPLYGSSYITVVVAGDDGEERTEPLDGIKEIKITKQASNGGVQTFGNDAKLIAASFYEHKIEIILNKQDEQDYLRRKKEVDARIAKVKKRRELNKTGGRGGISPIAYT